MTREPSGVQVPTNPARDGVADVPRKTSATPAWKPVVFLVAAIACTTPWASPPIALGVGIVLALLEIAVFEKWGKKASRLLIQACIVALGLRLDLSTLAHAAWDGLALALGTIAGAVAAGIALGRLLRTGREISTLITGGTAICGGSAIAAIGSSIRASASGMAIATGAVFVLNAIALFAFPLIARWLHLSDHQFGLWAGVAIHDISSVVGAATSYDATLRAAGASAHALDTANVVKLTRVIWILPLSLLAAWWDRRARAKELASGAVAEGSTSAGAPFPWFILAFLAASAVRTAFPEIAEWGDSIKFASGLGFQLALFLIGAALSPSALKQVGWRALAQAVLLWLTLAAGTLLVVMNAGSLSKRVGAQDVYPVPGRAFTNALHHRLLGGRSAARPGHVDRGVEVLKVLGRCDHEQHAGPLGCAVLEGVGRAAGAEYAGADTRVGGVPPDVKGDRALQHPEHFILLRVHVQGRPSPGRDVVFGE